MLASSWLCIVAASAVLAAAGDTPPLVSPSRPNLFPPALGSSSGVLGNSSSDDGGNEALIDQLLRDKKTRTVVGLAVGYLVLLVLCIAVIILYRVYFLPSGELYVDISSTRLQGVRKSRKTLSFAAPAAGAASLKWRGPDGVPTASFSSFHHTKMRGDRSFSRAHHQQLKASLRAEGCPHGPPDAGQKGRRAQAPYERPGEGTGTDAETRKEDATACGGGRTTSKGGSSDVPRRGSPPSVRTAATDADSPSTALLAGTPPRAAGWGGADPKAEPPADRASNSSVRLDDGGGDYRAAATGGSVTPLAVSLSYDKERQKSKGVPLLSKLDAPYGESDLDYREMTDAGRDSFYRDDGNRHNGSRAQQQQQHKEAFALSVSTSSSLTGSIPSLYDPSGSSSSSFLSPELAPSLAGTTGTAAGEEAEEKRAEGEEAGEDAADAADAAAAAAEGEGEGEGEGTHSTSAPPEPLSTAKEDAARSAKRGSFSVSFPLLSAVLTNVDRRLSGAGDGRNAAERGRPAARKGHRGTFPMPSRAKGQRTLSRRFVNAWQSTFRQLVGTTKHNTYNMSVVHALLSAPISLTLEDPLVNEPLTSDPLRYAKALLRRHLLHDLLPSLFFRVDDSPGYGMAGTGEAQPPGEGRAAATGVPHRDDASRLGGRTHRIDDDGAAIGVTPASPLAATRTPTGRTSQPRSAADGERGREQAAPWSGDDGRGTLPKWQDSESVSIADVSLRSKSSSMYPDSRPVNVAALGDVSEDFSETVPLTTTATAFPPMPRVGTVATAKAKDKPRAFAHRDNGCTQHRDPGSFKAKTDGSDGPLEGTALLPPRDPTPGRSSSNQPPSLALFPSKPPTHDDSSPVPPTPEVPAVHHGSAADAPQPGSSKPTTTTTTAAAAATSSTSLLSVVVGPAGPSHESPASTPSRLLNPTRTTSALSVLGGDSSHPRRTGARTSNHHAANSAEAARAIRAALLLASKDTQSSFVVNDTFGPQNLSFVLPAGAYLRNGWRAPSNAGADGGGPEGAMAGTVRRRRHSESEARKQLVLRQRSGREHAGAGRTAHEDDRNGDGDKSNKKKKNDDDDDGGGGNNPRCISPQSTAVFHHSI